VKLTRRDRTCPPPPPPPPPAQHPPPPRVLPLPVLLWLALISLTVLTFGANLPLPSSVAADSNLTPFTERLRPSLPSVSGMHGWKGRMHGESEWCCVKPMRAWDAIVFLEHGHLTQTEPSSVPAVFGRNVQSQCTVLTGKKVDARFKRSRRGNQWHPRV
jgi:hypothetical protein